MQNKLKRLGEALGKATGMSLMGSVPEAAHAVIQKVQKHFLKVRASQADAYSKEEFKVIVTSLENLMDDLVTAVPSLSGLQKTGSKRKHDEMAPEPAMPLEDGSVAELHAVAAEVEGGAAGSQANQPSGANAGS